ncbi:hypothetical protein HWV62_32037 [Athelia sp. TMB]|nr:hypothetical protein HWV62_32037 [Athelia sp. TMB]
MDAPMSGWFVSLPHSIDSVANAVKSSHFQPPQLSHAQAAPTRQLQDRDSMTNPRTMMPPPLPPTHAVRASGGFKPSTAQRGQPRRPEQNQPTASRRQIGPPSTPQIGSTHPSFGTSSSTAQHQVPQLRVPKASFPSAAHEPQSATKPSARLNGVSGSNDRFNPPSARFIPPDLTGGTQRFSGMPTATPSSRPSRAYANVSHNQPGQSGQRKPFVPSGEGAFG